MDWNGNDLRIPYDVSHSASDTSDFSFPYKCSFNQFSEILRQQNMAPTIMENNMNNLGVQSKKKRLSDEQLEMLEKSFQEEIKLEPDRKMKLAKELGLQPRQIAVWFQNRKARWKVKQLERLYESLKQDYDVVSRDKQKLQQEVVALREILKKHVGKNQVSTNINSGEETVESTFLPSYHKRHHHHDMAVAAAADMTAATNHLHIADSNYLVNMEEYINNTVMMPSFWLPTSHPN